MEDTAAKDQSSASGRSTSRFLRYPLRSATRSKEEKPPVAASISSDSATKRGRLASSVTKSVGVLDLSGKDKSAKPPRRLSVPSKSNTPATKTFGNITPISEARAKRSAVNQGKSDTPASDVSRSSNRKKFSVLSSASYWLSQIKLSESVAKHSISLGFFKLALEAGCEPLQRMSDELKSYVRRHNLSELGESVKELFEIYKIPENCEASRTCSEVLTEHNQLSDDDVNSSSSSITDSEKLKPESPGINADENQQEPNNEITQKDESVKNTRRCINADENQQEPNNEITQKDESVKKTRRSVSKNAASSKSGSEVRGRNIQKKSKKSTKQESVLDNNEKVKKQGKKSARGKGPLNSPPPKEALQENKENMVAAPQTEEISSTEV